MLTQNLFRSPLFSSFRYGESPRELQRLHEEIDRLVNGTWSSRPSEYPALNVWSNQEGSIITAELPGLTAEDIDISVVQNTLTLRGTRKPNALGEGQTYHRQERWHGQFVRSLELPFAVDADKVEASFHNGILSIRLPRPEEHKPRKIAIKTA